MGQLYEEITMAGFGGQGILLAGKVLAQAAMEAGNEVTFMPSYGAEVRGGTANCMVIIADEPIANPAISNPGTLIAMNKASLTKFGQKIKNNGLVIYNSSTIDDISNIADDIEIIGIPADDLANQLGNFQSANMVVLGAFLKKNGHISIEQAALALPKVLAKRYHHTLPKNIEALHCGADFIISAAKSI
jgi:2-oxoglutarate ferredoxin oxidoreductase subunit gamma